MSSISRFSGDNFGGVVSLLYALHANVKNQIDFYASNIQLSQAFIDANFFSIVFEREQCELKEPSQVTSIGKSRTISVVLAVPKDRQEIADQLSLVDDRALWLLLKDQNGNFKLIGNDDETVRQREDYSSGSRVSHTNGYRFKFSGRFKSKAPIITIV
jgi:hypothetical protein